MRSGPEAGVRVLTTPEGLTIPFALADPGDRLAAFAADVLLVSVLVTTLVLLAGMSVGFDGGFLFGTTLLLSFLVRNFYFAFFELRWGGATPGKRRFGLRVISRDGGPLTAEAVFARNLTRDVEVFLPLTVLVEPQALLPGLPAWAAFLGSLWLLLFGLVPFLNRDRLRVGDLIAGTMVVQMPRRRLLPDLVDDADARARVAGPYVFTPEQLDVYGIRELQVLEEVLRRSGGHRNMETLAVVAGKIKAKIGWSADATDRDDWGFLTSFYKAQRARLEGHLLLGKRRETKRR